MSPFIRAIAWAIMSLLVAVASIFDLIPSARAATLCAVFPALMVVTMKRAPGASCRWSA